MTDKRQSDALRLADELEDSLESHDGSSLTARCQGIADDAAAELRSQYAELEALRAGYAAARLDIETLKAQLAAQQPGVAYAALPEPITYQIAVLKACEHGDALVGWRVEPSRQSFDASMRPKRKLYTEGNMHDFADRTHALRVSHWQAPAQSECLTCNDHGAVGNILTAEPCPDCTRKAAPAAVAGFTRDATLRAMGDYRLTSARL